MDDLIRDFVVETIENLDMVDAELVRFEHEPHDQTIVARIFRLVHTIKGTCGFLALPRLERITHSAEGLISQFRSGRPATVPEVSLVLKAIDSIRFIVQSLGEAGQEPDGDDRDIVIALDLAAAHAPETTRSQSGASESGSVFQVLERALRPGEVTLDELERAFQSAPGPQNKRAPALVSASAATSNTIAPTAVVASSVRVAVDRLDHLMNMVSELVLVRNQLMEVSRNGEAGGFKLPLQRLSHITGELQDGVMRTRMQSIGTAWHNIPRVVRDLSNELGKQIRIESSGDNTEIDRQLLETIKECIVHIVRNAADHGIEAPAERIAADKPPSGLIRLNAGQQGSSIIVEISDDGRGIDIDRVRDRAFAAGLIDEDARFQLPDQSIARLIFEPGFSTAASVTNVSGRGVGLDVVRASIEQAGGSVDIANHPGLGTSIVLKLPLTLAIAAVLIVESAGQRFAIPQIAIAELVRTQPDSEVRIEHISGMPTLRLRSDLLPLIDLASALGVRSQEPESSCVVVICEFGDARFGIAVDTVQRSEEIVVKPISAKLRHIPYFSGATMLGDGAVVLILEPAGFARLADVSGTHLARNTVEKERSSGNDVGKTALLLFRAGNGNLKAVPLALIGRLEDIDASTITMSGDTRVLQYQDRLMRLVPATPDTAIQADRQPLLVFSHGGHSIGVLVDEIVDVIDVALEIDLSLEHRGFVGSALIQGQAVDILDVAALFSGFDTVESRSTAVERFRSILLVEKSEFFRAMLAPLIRGCGFAVELVETPEQAQEMARREVFDTVVIDLDGTVNDGLKLARCLAEDPLAGTPAIVGIATRCNAGLLARARDAGISTVIGKFDRQALLRVINGSIQPVEVAA